MSKWTVWVSGGEINDHYLDSEQVAQDLAQSWIDKGYDEVVVEEVTMNKCKSDKCNNEVDTFYYCDDHFEEAGE